MPIQYTPACTNRLDLIGRLIGQVHGMAHGCHLFNGDALADLQANLEEMVDFAKNPNITGCDPQALKFIDYNGVGPLQEMLTEVNSLIERHQKNPKQYVDNRLATTTIGDIESEWIFAIQQLNNFYNKRMDTGTNGTSDLIVPSQPYTPLRVIEEGMDSTGCPVPAAYHHIRSNPVQCLIDAGGGYQVIHPETGEVLTYEEAVSTLSKQYGNGPRGLPWYKPASEGEAIWYIRYLIAPMIRDRNVQMAQGRHENEILDYARADYNQLLWGVDASSDDPNHKLALYRAIIHLRGDSGVPYTETPPLFAKMKELLPTELNHWHDLLRLESDLSARADAIDERDNKIVEAIYLAEEAAIERGVQTGDCPPPKRGTHRIVPPQGETWSSRAWKQFPGKDPSAWYHHSGEWELARIIKAGGGIKDIVDPKTGEILSLQEAEKKLNFQVSPRQHWGPWDEQYYQSTFPNSPISDWVSGTIGSLRHMRNEADWSRQIETTSKQMHADEKVIEWYDDFITDLPTGVPIHDATRTLRPQEQFYVDNLPRSVTGERQIIQLIEKLDNQRSKLHDEDLPMLHAIADAEQAAIIRGLNVDAEETPGTWMDTRPPSVEEAISRATHYSGGFLYLNDPRFDQLLAEEDIVANLHFVPEEGTGLYPDDESWDDYTIAESAEARKQEHLHRQIYNIKNTLLRAYMDKEHVPDIDPDRDAQYMYQQFVDRFLVPSYEGADFTQRGETLPSERMLQLLPTSVGGAADLFAVEDKIDQFAEVLRQEDNDILRLIMEAEEKAIEADQAGIQYEPSAMSRAGQPVWARLSPEEQEEWREEAEAAAQAKRDEWIRAIGRGPDYMQQDLWEIIMPSTNWASWNLPFPRGGQLSSPLLQERWKGRKIPTWLKVRAFAMTPEGQAMTRTEIAKELGTSATTVSHALQGHYLHRAAGQHQYYGPPIQVRMGEGDAIGLQTRIERGFQTAFGEQPPEDEPLEYIEQRDADILRLHGEGKINIDIMWELGITARLINTVLAKAGLTPNMFRSRGRSAGRGERREPQLEEMRRLREQGLTYREIGERLGFSMSTVWYNLHKPSAMARAGDHAWSSLTPEQQKEWREEAEDAAQAKRDEWIRAVGRGPNYMEQDLWEIILPSTNWVSWGLPFPRGGQISSPMLQERWQGRKMPGWLKIRAFAMTPEGQAKTRVEIAKELGVSPSTVYRALQGRAIQKGKGEYQYYGPPIQVRVEERRRRSEQTKVEHGFSTAYGEMPPEDQPLEYVEQRNADILRLHGEGKVTDEIRTELGISPQTVLKIIEDAGLTPNMARGRGRRTIGGQHGISQLEEMRRLREQGLSYDAIAKRLGVGQTTVWMSLNKPSAMRRGGQSSWANLTPEEQKEWREEAETAAQAVRDRWIGAVGRGPNYMEQDLWEIVMPKDNWASWNLPFPRGGQISSSRLEERWQSRKIPLWLKVRAYAVTPEGQAMNQVEIAKELGVSMNTVSVALQGRSFDKTRGYYQYYGPPIQVRIEERERKALQKKIERGFATPFGDMPPEDQPVEYIEQRDADILRLHGEGKYNADIAREMGVARNLVRKVLKDAGLTPNITVGGGRIKGIEYPIEAQIEEMRRLRAEGLIYREIGERLGMSKQRVWYHLRRLSEEETPGTWIDTRSQRVQEAIWRGTGGFNLTLRHPLTNEIVTEGEAIDSLHYLPAENTGLYPDSEAWDTFTHTGTLESYAQAQLARNLDAKASAVTDYYKRKMDDPSIDVDKETREMYGRFREEFIIPSENDAHVTARGWAMPPPRILEMFPTRISGAADLMALSDKVDQFERVLEQEDQEVLTAIMEAEANAIDAGQQNIQYTPSAMRRGGSRTWSTLTPEQQEEWREEAEQAAQAVRDKWIRAVGRGPDYMQQDLWEIIMPKSNWAGWNLPFPRGGQISSSRLEERWQGRKIPNWLKIRAFAATPEGQAMNEAEIARELGVSSSRVSTALQGHQLDRARGQHQYYGPPIQVRMDEVRRKAEQTRIERGFATPFGELSPEEQPLEYIEQRDADIIRLHGEGKVTDEIWRELGLSERIVSRILKKAGLTPNMNIHGEAGNGRRRLTAAHIEEARRLRAEGLSYREIAERLGLPRKTVWYNLQKPASWFDNYPLQIKKRIKDAGGLIVKHPDTGQEMTLLEVSRREHYDYHSNPTVNPYTPTAQTMLERHAKSTHARWLNRIKNDLAAPIRAWGLDQSPEWVDWNARKEYEELLRWHRDWPTKGRPTDQKINMLDEWDRFGHILPEEVTGVNDLIQLRHTIEKEQQKLLDSDRKLHIAVMNAEDELFGFNAPNTPSAWLGSMETPPEYDKDIFDYSYNQKLAETEGMADLVMWRGSKIGPSGTKPDITRSVMEDYPVEVMQEDGYTDASVNWDIGDIHVSLDKGPWRNQYGEMETVAQVAIETMVDAGESGSAIFGAEGQIGKINELLKEYQRLNPGIRVIANARGEQHPESGRARGRGDIRARVYARYGWVRLPEGRTMGGGILMELPPSVEDDIPGAFAGVSKYANEIMELVG